MARRESLAARRRASPTRARARAIQENVTCAERYAARRARRAYNVKRRACSMSRPRTVARVASRACASTQRARPIAARRTAVMASRCHDGPMLFGPLTSNTVPPARCRCWQAVTIQRRAASPDVVDTVARGTCALAAYAAMAGARRAPAGTRWRAVERASVTGVQAYAKKIRGARTRVPADNMRAAYVSRRALRCARHASARRACFAVRETAAPRAR